MELVSGNGGAAVLQMLPKAYVNLDKGVVDAAFLKYTQISDYKLPTILNYFYNQNFGAGWFPVIVNNEIYNAMSAQDKVTLNATWMEAAKLVAPDFVSSRNDGIKAIRDAGR